MTRSYRELLTIPTFEERYEYLRLRGDVGEDTFGFDRYLNQRFYRSAEWKRVRDQVILRDDGCDLAIKDRAIFGRVIIHHMNPVLLGDLLNHIDDIMNPEYLICCSHDTHNAIHYGSSDLLVKSQPIERKPNDTIPWRK